MDVIIPIYNEEDVLGSLFEALEKTFSPAALKARGIGRVRYLFVDDGSGDSSASLIAEKIRLGWPATLYRLSRNFGHQNAVSAGLRASRGDAVAVIDADLQDPPGTVLAMVDLWRQGYDVVFGERKKRKEGVGKIFCYWLYYRLLSFLSTVKVPLDSGDFSLMDRRVVEEVSKLPERLRFPRGLRSWVGFRQIGLAYERDQRRAGRSKYSLDKLYHLATDGIASLSIKPLKIAQFFTVVYLLVSFGLTLLSLEKYLLRQSDPIALWFFATYAMISLGNFMTLFCLYVLSAYVGRTYLEVQGRPSYIVMEVVGDDGSS